MWCLSFGRFLSERKGDSWGWARPSNDRTKFETERQKLELAYECFLLKGFAPSLCRIREGIKITNEDAFSGSLPSSGSCDWLSSPLALPPGKGVAPLSGEGKLRQMGRVEGGGCRSEKLHKRKKMSTEWP